MRRSRGASSSDDTSHALGLRRLRVELGAAPADFGVMYPADSELSQTAKGLIDALKRVSARVARVDE